MNVDTIIAAISVCVAALAFYVTYRSDSRSATTTRTEMYLMLRTRFLEILRQLPDRDRDAMDYTANEKAAVVAYWHHVCDEWYVTSRLNRREMHKMWLEFYVPRILGGMRHRGYRTVLIETIEEEETSGLGEYGEACGDEMKRLLAQAGFQRY